MIHILRLIVGIVIMYLLASNFLVLNYFVEEEKDMDDLPIYIKIPGVLCLFTLACMLILLTAHTLGGVILG